MPGTSGFSGRGFSAVEASQLPKRRHGGKGTLIWQWLKIKQEGLRRFWSMFPLTRVPFWHQLFEPQPFVVAAFKGRRWEEHLTGAQGTTGVWNWLRGGGKSPLPQNWYHKSGKHALPLATLGKVDICQSLLA